MRMDKFGYQPRRAAMRYEQPHFPWLMRLPFSVCRRLTTDEVLPRDAEDRTTISVLLEGTGRVSLQLPDGRERMISFVPTGSVVGELSAFSSGPFKSGFCFIANSDCLLGHVSTETLIEEIRAHPEHLPDLMRMVVLKMSTLLQELQRAAFRDSMSQICALILTLAETGHEIRINHSRLAQLAGRTRVTVAAQLKQLKEMGVIRLGRARIEVLDISRLAVLSHAAEWDVAEESRVLQ